MALTHKTILITRSKNASAELQGMLESKGASVVCLPALEITDPDSWADCDSTIWKIAEYDSICFTSKNSVEKFIQRTRLIRPQALNTLATQNIYAVGEKTRLTLEASGFSVQPIPQKHSSENLARSFYGQGISGRHFLFPKGNIARDVLPKELRSLGAIVDEVVVYKTVIPEPENLNSISKLLAEKKIDVVTFFSPSSVRNLVEMIGVELLQHASIAVLGPTTAEAVKGVGLETEITAKQQTAESLVEEIVAHYNHA